MFIAGVMTCFDIFHIFLAKARETALSVKNPAHQILLIPLSFPATHIHIL